MHTFPVIEEDAPVRGDWVRNRVLSIGGLGVQPWPDGEAPFIKNQKTLACIAISYK